MTHPEAKTPTTLGGPMPPLTRDRVTAASRIMLPTYPILFLLA